MGVKSGLGDREVGVWPLARCLKAAATQQNSRRGMGVADIALKTAEKAASNNSNTGFGLFACE